MTNMIKTSLGGARAAWPRMSIDPGLTMENRQRRATTHPSRVMLVSNFYPPYTVGGAEIVTSYLAQWLSTNVNEVTVVTTCSREARLVEEFQERVRVIRFFPRNLWWNYDRFSGSDIRSALSKGIWQLRDAWNASAARQFRSILRETDPDVIHTHNLKGFSPAIWSEAQRAGIPIVHTTHDYHLLCLRGVMTKPSSGTCVRRCAPCLLHGSWYRAQAVKVTVLCSPSKFVLARHNAAGIKGKSPGLVIPNGVSQKAGSPRALQSDRRLRLLFVGQLRREKGAHLLLEIMARLDAGVTLEIAGDGDLAQSIASQARGDPRITLHGFVFGAAKQALFKRADVLLFPSQWTENAPLVLAEAAMEGLPVIASNLGAIPEFVEDGVTGYLVPPGDAQAFADAVDRIRTEGASLSTLSANSRRSSARYSIDTMGKSYLRSYRHAMTHVCFDAPSPGSAQ